jgi:hypothetical protein
VTSRLQSNVNRILVNSAHQVFCVITADEIRRDDSLSYGTANAMRRMDSLPLGARPSHSIDLMSFMLIANRQPLKAT